jgi:hypothetical protein
MPLSVSAPFRLCSFPCVPLSGLTANWLCQIPLGFFSFCFFPFMPLSFLPLTVYAPFRFSKYLMPNYFLPLSVYAPFLYATFQFWTNWIMPLFFMPPSSLKQNELCFFPVCLFSFTPLSVYAPFRIDGKCRLCRMHLCQLPRPRLHLWFDF